MGTAPHRRPGGLGSHPMHARGLVAAAIRQHTDGPGVMLKPIAAQPAAEGQDQVRAVAGPQKPRGRERGDVRLRRRRAASGQPQRRQRLRAARMRRGTRRRAETEARLRLLAAREGFVGVRAAHS